MNLRTLSMICMLMLFISASNTARVISTKILKQASTIDVLSKTALNTQETNTSTNTQNACQGKESSKPASNVVVSEFTDSSQSNKIACQVVRTCKKTTRPGVGRVILCSNELVCG